jgi:hypothetical protein
MAKAINWPLRFRQTVLSEDDKSLHSAFRPNRLYYDGGYWVDGERVDIRVNHLVTRKAHIVGNLELCALKDLSEEALKRHKPGVQTIAEVLSYLQQAYPEAHVTPETLLTVVTYRNEPVDEAIIESTSNDPHM